MTTHAPLAPPDLNAATERHDVVSGEPGHVDVIPRLDPATTRRLVPPALARHGPHLVIDVDGETRMLPLERKLTHVGRGVTADVRIDDQRISRAHAIIVVHGRHARLLDNRSSNGTFQNGRRITATTLADGDVVEFGPVMVRYVEVDVSWSR